MPVVQQIRLKVKPHEAPQNLSQISGSKLASLQTIWIKQTSEVSEHSTKQKQTTMLRRQELISL